MIRPIEISCDGTIHALTPQWNSTNNPINWIQAEIGPTVNGIVLDGITVSKITATNLARDASHFCSLDCLSQWLESKLFPVEALSTLTPPMRGKNGETQDESGGEAVSDRANGAEI